MLSFAIHVPQGYANEGINQREHLDTCYTVVKECAFEHLAFQH